MRTRGIGTLLFLGILVAAVPAAAQHLPIQGTFILDANRSDNVEEAINAAVAGMNAITRPVARGRLRRTNAPYRRITITSTGESVSVTTDSRAPIVTPADGGSIRWTREDGEVFDVNTQWQNGALQQTFAADDGRRVNVYSLSSDGRTLTLQATITSGRLRRPLTYRLVFARETT